MNNLHRELAPISDGAWAQIEQEATRTLKRHLAGRRVVDVHGPGGFDLSAISTGHLVKGEEIADGTSARLRAVQPLVELRTPFEVDRQAIDDVERGAQDSDWQTVKDAAKQLAFAEDRAIFEGSAAAGIVGIRSATSNPVAQLPADARAYPDVITQERASAGGSQRPVPCRAERGRLHGRQRDAGLRLPGARAHQTAGE